MRLRTRFQGVFDLGQRTAVVGAPRAGGDQAGQVDADGDRQVDAAQQTEARRRLLTSATMKTTVSAWAGTGSSQQPVLE